MHPSRITAIIIASLTVVAAFVSGDPVVIVVAGAVLAIGIFILWTNETPPVLMLPFILQWISVALKPIETVFTGSSLADLTVFGGDLRDTAIFSLIAVLSLAVGLRLSLLGGRQIAMKRLSQDAFSWSDSGIAWFSLTLIGIGHVLAAGFGRFGGFNEMVSTLSGISYVGLFMLLYWSLRTHQQQRLTMIVFAFEIVLGMSGFYGEFKTVLFVAAMALISSQQKVGARSAIIGSALAVASLVVMVFWSEVKPEYREYMTYGNMNGGQQRPISDRLNFLLDEATTFDGAKFAQGYQRLIDRASYIDFLAAVREFVPTNTPFEGGQRTLAGVNHVITPRILFPNKPPLESDTEVTARYTGLAFTNYDASISIGYLAELYIDFGNYGAYIAEVAFGLMLGLACRGLMANRTTPMLLNAGLAVMLTFPLCLFEQALVKTIGGFFMSMILLYILQRVVFGTLLAAVLARMHRQGPTPATAPAIGP